MGRSRDEVLKVFRRKIQATPYRFCHYKQFDYDLLKYIPYIYTAGHGERVSYNDIIIMADTETSKKKPDIYHPDSKGGQYETFENHVVAWTISLRAFNHNIVTLYGRKPSKMIETITRIHEHMAGTRTVIYFHNLGYDHIFLRKFAYKYWGRPEHQLNVKPYYPILIQYQNGIMIKDSLILAQRKLEKWADDLDVEHKKAVGSWDYDEFRNQDTPLSDEEKHYIECDTLAGVECIDKTLEALHKRIYSIPLTATGIPREQTRIRGKKEHARDWFLQQALTYVQYNKFTMLYHGGFTHGDRHFVNTIIRNMVQCYDFASSYPYCMCAFKFPAEKFTHMENTNVDFILSEMEDYAFAFKFIAVNIKLKRDTEPMPALQFSKCIKAINAIQDNGRILAANYVEIYLTEYDLAVIADIYTWDKHICCDVEYAAKSYLPRWFTDFVYECFKDKTMLKGADPVLYSIAKAKLNSLYGMCCMKSIRMDILENYDTGDFEEEEDDSEEALQAKYIQYVEKINTILPYQIGVWVTSIAFYNLRQLVKCCEHPYYSDTDSCYGSGWNEDLVRSYNEACKEKLRSNEYGPVIHKGREYWLGVAETEGDADKYTEFRYMGAKRYCGRNLETGKLKITVAGVPKKNGAKCLHDDIREFCKGAIFDGATTGKTTHYYFNVEDIYIDEAGNETGDSISLTPCDYRLDTINVYDWQSMFNEEVQLIEYDVNL